MPATLAECESNQTDWNLAIAVAGGGSVWEDRGLEWAWQAGYAPALMKSGTVDCPRVVLLHKDGMLLGIARHPVVTFAIVFGLVIVLGVVIDGRLETRLAIFGALGGTLGAALAAWLRGSRRSG
jgi:uncharacterized membrane protein